MTYKRIRLEDLINAVKENPELFPDGMKTIIYSGDFEGNYTHKKHEIGCMKLQSKNNRHAIVLNYEMHEGGWE